ncbi:MAG: efflux RND transporter periplasmic adaptor subunit, partial [Gemmatimonadaceae bacterium]|nr:efflux RND transporter periplasmic adaptor subunit [Gemmatimonadaceae bacterium]
LALLVTLAGCGGGAAAASTTSDVIPVVAAEVREGSRADAIEVTGTLGGQEEVPLAFKIGGIVARIGPRAGDVVRAGQRLAELRPTEIAAQVSTSDEAIAKAERDLARVEQLHADSVATLEQLQDARTALAVARNGGRIARFNADYAVINAPGDGIVLERSAEPGQLVEPGRAVLVVRRAGSGMVVRAALADRDAVRVQAGDTASVRFDALPGQRFTGRVQRRGAKAAAGAGSYEVEIALGADAAALPSGLVAQVTIVPARGASASIARPLVPIEALVDADGDSAAVFVVKGDGRSVERRAVRLTDVAEALHDAMLPVTAGVRAGERVVVGNTARLVDGARITIATPGAAQDDAPTWRTVP